MLPMHEQLMSVTEALLACPNGPDYIRSVLALLVELFDADDCLWVDVDITPGSVGTMVQARVGTGRMSADARMAGVPSHLVADHPAVVNYLADPRGLDPRRLSDVTTRAGWRATAAHRALLHEPEADHQLSLVVSLSPPSRGRGWVLLRATPDFSDAQCDLARALHPVLLVLDRMHRPGVLPRQRLDLDTSAARARWGLTEREAEVLGHLGQGLTAEAMARTLGISSRTVRKHLERLYEKSGMHDRLLVVQHAWDLLQSDVPPNDRLASTLERDAPW
jgi:DNA-binding CsgD family transcriptional regulator